MTDAGSPVDAIVVNWNGARFLPRCLESLGRSSIPLRVTVVDNASEDGSVEYVRAHHPWADVLALESNRGYAGGANAGLAATRGRYAFILNPDLAVADDHVEILARRLDSDPSIGAAQGKLYRVSPEDFLEGHLRRRSLDSAGHVICRTRMVFDRAQGEPDDGRWDREASVFSASGAAMIVRRSMVEGLAPAGEPFDTSFFAYKEDIDLCWRARLAGWDVRYVPSAAAWHVRAWPGPRSRRTRIRSSARRHSWKNHYLLMIRNDRLSDWLRHLPWIAGWEAIRIGYALLRAPGLLGGYRCLADALPGAWRARRRIQAARRVDPRDFRRWFGADVRPVGEEEGTRVRDIAREP